MYCVHACVCMRACGIVHSWYDVDVVRAYVVTLRMCHVCACEERVQVCVRDECGRARGCAMAAAVAMPMGGDGGDW